MSFFISDAMAQTAGGGGGAGLEGLISANWYDHLALLLDDPSSDEASKRAQKTG